MKKQDLSKDELQVQLNLKLIESLRASERKYKDLVKNLKQIVFQLDMDGCFVFLNEAWETVAGFTIDEVISHSLLEFIHESDREITKSKLQFAYDNPEKPQDEFECRLVSKNSQIIIVEIYLTPLKGINNIEGVIGTVFDVTAHKEVMEELRINKDRLFFALQGADDGFWDWNLENDYVYYSPRWKSMLGFKDEELTENHLDLFERFVDPDDKDRVYDLVEDYLSGTVEKFETEFRMKHKDGHWVNILSRASLACDDNGNIAIPKRLVGTHVDITQRKKYEREIQELAYYDPLTRLPNRRFFMERLKQILASCHRNRTHGALLFIDLDNFKTLNDTYGHDVGDLLLVDVASRINKCIRENDTVARLGGDEFVVMLEALGSEYKKANFIASRIADKILKSINQNFQIDKIAHQITSSIGICLFKEEYENIEDVLKFADTAMYEAKKSGRNTICFFDPVMQHELQHNLKIEKELNDALFKEEFLLHYQLIVDSNKNNVGVEALIRWNHPEKGILSPAIFLPLIESNGMIVPIGEWVIAEGLRQLQKWQKTKEFSSLTLSINISAIQFQKPNFINNLIANIEKYKINPNCLILELTESCLINDLEQASKKIHDLDNMGIQLSLDDFGTGYSSLNYLKLLSIKQLKIEQTFINDILNDHRDLMMVKTILDIGRNLGLDVVAEGVERQEQFLKLKEIGCSRFQGYLINKPMPINEVNAIIKGGSIHPRLN